MLQRATYVHSKHPQRVLPSLQESRESQIKILPYPPKNGEELPSLTPKKEERGVESSGRMCGSTDRICDLRADKTESQLDKEPEASLGYLRPSQNQNQTE